MSTTRLVALALGLLLIVPLVGGIGLVVWVQSQLPPAQSDRVRGPHELVGIQTGNSYSWVVPGATGVVLIDAGLEPTGKLLRREIGNRPVHAILLTHAHGDHTSGLAAWPDVPVHAAAADLALLEGKREARGWLAAGFFRMFGRSDRHGPLVEVTDGQELRIDGLRFRASHVPGHTDGSVAWLWQDVLFTGDAVLGGARLTHAPPALADDPAQAERSVAKLLDLDFDGIADGHVGYTGAARPALFRLANQRPYEPTISIRSAGGVGGAAAERTGIYVQSPPDVRGEAPELVVFSDGTAWRISHPSNPERAADRAAERAARAGWDGRAVVVRGRIGAAGAGPGLPAEVESIRLADQQPAPNRPLAERVGEWVTVRGSVRRLDPLTGGAGWGEGELVLEDGTTVALSAPLSAGPAGVGGSSADPDGSAGPGGSRAWRVRVERIDSQRIRLVAAPRIDAPPTRGAGP